MMRDALLRDLQLLPNISLITTHDARLASPLLGSVPISEQDVAMTVWQSLLQNCDAVFIVAPETGGKLADLVRLVNHRQVLHLGCSVSAIEVASSKYQTYQQLTNVGVDVVPTYQFNEFKQHIAEDSGKKWVVKPDDGAGCDGAVCFENGTAASVYLASRAQTHVIQPLIDGVAASISMLCKDGQAWLLSCNLQKVELINNKFHYHGSVVGGSAAYQEEFAFVAQQIATAMPDLAGYVGIDVITNRQTVTVLEINPRLTTSYVGLHQSIEFNPAQLMVDLFFNPAFTMPLLNNQLVEINLKTSDVYQL